MSTLGYAELTSKRLIAEPKSSTAAAPPGMGAYIDVLAALTPAEALSLHAVILSVTTRIDGESTRITDMPTLAFAFWGLVALSAFIYAAPRLFARNWESLDWARVFIPPLAFVGWTMLQRTTAFDAAFPDTTDPFRSVLALFLAALLGMVAAGLAYKADAKPPVAATESK